MVSLPFYGRGLEWLSNLARVTPVVSKELALEPALGL